MTPIQTRMTPKKRPIKKHSQDRWEVDYGLDEHGKKKRVVVRTEGEADELIEVYEKGVKKQGDWWIRLKPLDRSAIQQAVTEMGAKNLTIGQVWSKYQEWSTAKDSESNITPKEYGQAVDEFDRIKKASGKSDRYVGEVTRVLRRFGKGQEMRHIHLVKPEELETWIHVQKTWGKKSQATNLVRFSTGRSIGKNMSQRPEDKPFMPKLQTIG